MHRVRPLIIIVLLAVAPSQGFAGPWGGLPDAVARLQNDPDDQAARAVIAEAEASILNEARSGRLAAVAVLAETYISLVMQLDDGEERVRRLEERTAAQLIAWGDQLRDSSPSEAGSAWTLAARYDASDPTVDRLREILFPPVDPEPGQVWYSVLDGADLVYQPPLTLRVGCSDNDRRCRENEIYFRWVEVPGFWIEGTEVTNRRYRLCVEAGRCSTPMGSRDYNNPDRDQLPVVGLSWRQAREYAGWVGRRLPSESEWERAARGKETRWRFPWGNNRGAEAANVWDETGAAGRGLLPVATFPTTGWGLSDMAGNAWEWCADRYQTGFKELPLDGSPMRSGAGRVVRGGSWRRSVDLARVSARSWFEEHYRADDVGFRCAVDRTSEISDARVLAAAEKAFVLRSTPGRELVGVELSTEDRRYLERRAVTWLMLERRTEEAVLQAATLLRRDPGDSVALDLLDWAEGEIVDEARAGNVRSVAVLRSRYLRAVTVSPRFERRMRSAEQRLVDALRQCGESLARSGDFNRAAACFELGLEIDVDDAALRRGRDSLQPAPGGTRIWPRDQRVMVWVPAGSFHYGASPNDRQTVIDELPAATRTIRGFWIDRNEVTNADYRRCVEAGTCTPPSRTEAFDDPTRANHPILWVSWYQAREYAKWAGKRLPSEMEWERAARAEATTRFPWGERWEPGRGNVFDIGGDDRWAGEAPVSSFPPNTWGIHDLIGNAAEWVQDVYHTSYSNGPTDGRPWEQETGPIAERRRVVRGGSYADPPSRQRVSRRVARKPAEDHRTTGFRCAAD
jgi:formylglycine-generating enzyme required for sulfatase activity